MKTAQQQADEALRNGTISQQQYDGLQREIVETEQELRRLEQQAEQSATALQKIGVTGEKQQAVGECEGDCGPVLAGDLCFSVPGVGGNPEYGGVCVEWYRGFLFRTLGRNPDFVYHSGKCPCGIFERRMECSEGDCSVCMDCNFTVFYKCVEWHTECDFCGCKWDPVLSAVCMERYQGAYHDCNEWHKKRGHCGMEWYPFCDHQGDERDSQCGQFSMEWDPEYYFLYSEWNLEYGIRCVSCHVVRNPEYYFRDL